MGKTITEWGRKCKAQMILLDMSLEDVGRETGLSRTYVSSIINGRTVAPAETVRKISDALQVAGASVR